MDFRHSITYGKERRKCILDYLSRGNVIYVNRKYCINTKYDTDVKYLLKKNKIELGREFRFSGIGTTFIKIVGVES